MPLSEAPRCGTQPSVQSMNETLAQFLVESYQNWTHPACRDPQKAFQLRATDHEPRDCVAMLLELLNAPTPAPLLERDNHDRYAALGPRLIRVIEHWRVTPPAEIQRRAGHAREMVQLVEPCLEKLCALLVESDARVEIKLGKGLGTLLLQMCKNDRLPYQGPLDQTFKQYEDWGQYDSYSNAWRDVIPERLDAAHAATEPAASAFDSAMVVILGAIRKNLHDLRKILRSDESTGHDTASAVRGVPAYRRIPDDSPEPFTSRRAWAHELASLCAHSNQVNPVVLVKSRAGDGKSFAICKALMEVDCRVFFVDVVACYDQRALAQAICDAFELRLTQSDRALLDSYPSGAAEFAADRFERVVVVFENISRTQPTLRQDELLSFIVRFRAHGHRVVLEATHSPDFKTKLPQAHIQNPQPLPRIEDQEIEQWARNVLGRQPTDSEQSIIALTDGHPSLTRFVLDKLVEHDDETVLNEILDEMVRHSELSERLDRPEEPYKTGLAPTMPDSIWCWLGVLPDAVVDSSHAIESLALKTAVQWGLIRRHAERYTTTCVGRLWGARWFLRDATPDMTVFDDFMLHVAVAVPTAKKQAAHRHLLCMLAARELDYSNLSRVLACLSDVSELRGASQDDGTPTAYTAPMPSQAIAHVLEHAQSASQAAENDESHAQLLVEAIDAAARIDETEQLLTLVRSDQVAAWFRADYSSQLDSLAGTLERLSPEKASTYRLYQGVLSHIDLLFSRPTTDELRMVGIRLLVGGAASALYESSRAQASLWRDSARSLFQELVARETPADADLIVEARYLLTRLECDASDGVLSSLVNHKAALKLVSESSMREHRGFRRHGRTLYHLAHLAEIDRIEVGHIPILDESLAALPFDAQKLRFYLTMRRRLSFQSHELATCVNAAIARERRQSTGRIGRQSVRTRILAVLGRTGRNKRQIAAWAAEAMSVLKVNWDVEYANLLIACIECGTPSHLASLTTGLVESITALRESGNEGPPEQVAALIRRLLSLGAAQLRENAEVFLRDSRLELWPARLARLEQDTDRLFRQNASIERGGWIYADWSEARINVVRLRNKYWRAARNPPSLERAPSSDKLIDFVSKLPRGEDVIGGVSLAQLLLARYTWDVHALRSATTRLLSSSMPSQRKTQILRVMHETWLNILFMPRLLNPPDLTAAPEDFAFLRASFAPPEASPSDSAESVMMRIAFVVSIDDDGVDAWSQLVRIGSEMLGEPSDFWNHFVGIAAAENSSADVAGQTFDMIEIAGNVRALTLLGRLARFGSEHTRLPRALRVRLGEIAVTSFAAALGWQRSLSIPNSNLSLRIDRATSIVCALWASDSRELFGTQESPYAGRNGVALSWVDVARQDLAFAQRFAADGLRERLQYISQTANAVIERLSQGSS